MVNRRTGAHGLSRMRSLGAMRGVVAASLLIFGQLTMIGVPLVGLGFLPAVPAFFGALLVLAPWPGTPPLSRATIAGWSAFFGTQVVATVLGSNFANTGSQVPSLGILAYSMTIGLGSYYLAIRLPRSHLRRTLRWGVLIVLGVAALERMSPAVKQALLGVREGLSPSGLLYEGWGRDLLLVDFVRPVFLAREPSHLAFTAGTLLVGWLLSARSGREMAVGAVLFAAAIAVVGSPVLLLAALAALVLVATRPASSRRESRELRWAKVAAVGIAAVVVVAGLWLLDDARLQDDSFAIRMLVPARLAFVRPEGLLLGTGVGGLDALAPSIVRSLSEANVNLSRLENSHIPAPVTNALAQYWIFNGLTFGVLVAVFVALGLRRSGQRGWLGLLLGLALMGNGVGSFVGPQMWISLGLLSGLAAQSDEFDPTAEDAHGRRCSGSGLSLQVARSP